jgi:hypothetical protein
MNPRKKAWISLDSFGRIGTFQWITANPSKKIFSTVTLWPNYHNRDSRVFADVTAPGGAKRGPCWSAE